MTTLAATERKLRGVHPKLAEAVRNILAVMDVLGHPMMVTDGVRTLQRQQELYAQGRTAPGKIVTNADGLRAKSNHQVKEDGWGHAVDMCFVVDGKPSWSEAHRWRLYGEVASAVGCSWGGFWKRPDKPHIELP